MRFLSLALIALASTSCASALPTALRGHTKPDVPQMDDYENALEAPFKNGGAFPANAPTPTFGSSIASVSDADEAQKQFGFFDFVGGLLGGGGEGGGMMGSIMNGINTVKKVADTVKTVQNVAQAFKGPKQQEAAPEPAGAAQEEQPAAPQPTPSTAAPGSLRAAVEKLMKNTADPVKEAAKVFRDSKISPSLSVSKGLPKVRAFLAKRAKHARNEAEVNEGELDEAEADLDSAELDSAANPINAFRQRKTVSVTVNVNA